MKAIGETLDVEGMKAIGATIEVERDEGNRKDDEGGER